MTDARASLIDPPEIAYVDWLTAAAPAVRDLGWHEHLKVDALGEGISTAILDVVPPQDSRIEVEGPPTFSISLFLEGQGTLSINGGRPLSITPGMAVVCATDQRVSGVDTVRGGARVRIVDVRFEPECLAALGGPMRGRNGGRLLMDYSVPERGALMVGFPAPPALLHAGSQIVACTYTAPDLRNLYLRAKALEILAITVATFREAGDDAVARPDREARKIAEAQHLLEARMAEAWTIARLARAVGLNEKSLKAGFRVQVGQSIHAYLIKLRIDAAAGMLKSGQSVTETALATGFTNLSHFSKTFRKVTGTSPRHFSGR